MKDVITGEIIENGPFGHISCLKTFNYDGFDMAYSLITEREIRESFSRHIMAGVINYILNKDILSETDIKKIRDIINGEIIKNYKKRMSKLNKLRKKESEFKKYSIDESERNF